VVEAAELVSGLVAGGFEVAAGGLAFWSGIVALDAASDAVAGAAAVEDALVSELFAGGLLDCWQESETDFTLVTL
jgi:hypothetical protein